MTAADRSLKDDPWEPFRFFLGHWTGVGSGKPGDSQVVRFYELVLDDQYIQLYDRAEYKPQEQNPDGEVHEEIAYISYDRNRRKYILREFHIEGYVNQYVLDEYDSSWRKMVFRTESIENIPPGWSARTTYEILGDNEFREIFELAGPDQEWDCYITNEFKRDL